jgi:hypothetical protein
METDLAPLAQALIALGCPAAGAMDMAGHLDRRERRRHVLAEVEDAIEVGRE